jgi:hypothetical protein
MINKFLYFLLVVTLISCDKKEDEKQQSELNADINLDTAAGKNSAEGLNKWSGRFVFHESAEGITPGTAQSWDWEVIVESDDKGSYKARVNIDGFQTMTRIEADIIANDSTIEFIFARYLPDNMFGSYKKGDRLFSFRINENGVMITEWDKMKPYITKLKKKDNVAFKKIVS